MRNITNSAPARRPLTLEERVNIVEGEDELSDSDDLDIVKTAAKEATLNEYISQVNQTNSIVEVSSDSSATQHSNSSIRKRKRKERKPGERIAWSGDEESDDAYQKFKNRGKVARKKALASTKRAKKNASGATMVGRRPKTVVPIKDDKAKVRRHDLQESDDENLMESTLPEYFKQRRNSWDQRKEDLGQAGLQLPPEYDDVYFSDDARLANLQEKPKLPKLTPPAQYKDVKLQYSLGIVPAPIAQWLRPYQIKGAEFLHEHFVYQKGGILGDDMGLGKTIQVIAFLTAVFGKTGDERDAKRMRKMRRMGDNRWYPRILIICPGSLMENWKSELNTWGWWQIYMFHGGPAGRDAALAAAMKGRLEIMITTYSTYRIHQSAINGIRWDCVIADECHIIKEQGAEITKAMNNINALCRIGLTGTAIQNKYEELWTLLNWTNPGRFGPMSTWKQSICLPLKFGQSHDATVSQLAMARKTAKKLVGNLLPAFFLRRMKSLIADQLPKKSDKVVFCPLTEIQSEAYNNFCDSEIVQRIRNSSEPCPCNSGKKQGWCCYSEIEGFGKWQHFVFPAIVTLQKLSNHVALMIPSGQDGKDKHDKEIEKLEIALPNMWKDLYRQRDSILNYANQEFCGKWRVLKKLLKLWHSNGDKVLVFSHSVRLLKMLRMLFQATTTYNVSYLDGGMTYEDRQKEVDEYNSDPGQFVFLISTKAGGVGLNITSANKVVVVDPNWNPSYDLQAQDRAYRIGQTRDVEVFRLVSAGTVEEIVYARQIYKQQQANIGYNASVERRYFKGVQDQKDMKGEIFGLTNLFAPLSDNVVLRDIVNKTNIAETKAGVSIIGLDMEASQEDGEATSPLIDGEKEDAAMSQLANEIIESGKSKRKAAAELAKKKDPVQAILASVGVEYTHENAEVIGTSKIETKISSRAQKAGNDIDQINEYAFAKDQSQVDGRAKDQSVYGADANGHESDNDGLGKVRYKFRPPELVRRRQFCTMAKSFGYEDVTEFALVVEGWTQEQRRNCLDKFYVERRQTLEDAK